MEGRPSSHSLAPYAQAGPSWSCVSTGGRPFTLSCLRGLHPRTESPPHRLHHFLGADPRGHPQPCHGSVPPLPIPPLTAAAWGIDFETCPGFYSHQHNHDSVPFLGCSRRPTLSKVLCPAPGERKPAWAPAAGSFWPPKQGLVQNRASPRKHRRDAEESQSRQIVPGSWGKQCKALV